MSATDDQGRVAQTCTIVQPGILQLERWEDGEPRLRFEFCRDRPLVGLRVISAEAPVPGALVHVAGVGWNTWGATGHDGVVNLLIDTTQITPAGVGLPRPSPFHRGIVVVTASKSGWQPRQENLWMVDCASLVSAVQAAKAYQQRVLDRLAGYAALRELQEQGKLANMARTDSIGSVLP